MKGVIRSLGRGVSGEKTRPEKKGRAFVCKWAERAVLSALPDQADDKTHDGHDGEDEKENLGDFDSACCDTTEAEHGCDQCDDQEND